MNPVPDFQDLKTATYWRFAVYFGDNGEIVTFKACEDAADADLALAALTDEELPQARANGQPEINAE